MKNQPSMGSPSKGSTFSQITPGKGPSAMSVGGIPLKAIAIALAAILIMAFAINSGVSGSKQQVANKDLETKSAGLQAQLDSLQVEKTRVEESLLQATLEKEQMKAAQEKEKIAAALERKELAANASKIKQLLLGKPYDPIVLDQARQNYVQWELYGCYYYLGPFLLTNAGNITIPTGCAITNGFYVNSSKFFIDQITNSSANPADQAIRQLEEQYPEIK